MQAYLVISQGSRWTDVFRLQSGVSVSIGRSSDNQIVIRDDRVSRHHAEIFLANGGWQTRDLGSRNGTQVNSVTIAEAHSLNEGDVIQVADCRMTFALDLARAFGPPPVPAAVGNSQASAAQTAELGTAPPVIVDRRNRSRWVASGRNEASASGKTVGAEVDEAQFLIRLMFELVSTKTPAEAAQLSLDRLLERLGVGAGGVMWLADDDAKPKAARTAKSEDAGARSSLLATKQAAGQAYHRISDFLVATLRRERQAVLARNVQMDEQLAAGSESSARQTSSIIGAPLVTDGTVMGLLHIYTSVGQRMLEQQDLELTVAVADTLAMMLAQQQERERLALSLDKSRRRIDQLEQELGHTNEMVGDSRAMKVVRQSIERAAPTPATVLVRGESGVGKELVARAIHNRSQRRDGPLVCLNCAALAPTLLESELFGHEKGAFTGATERKIGKFEAADGGTLLLDEIGEMSPELQAKFLRVLEGQPFERLGGNKPIQVNVRVIAATNRDLEQAVREKQFRADLYYRLRVIEIFVPALRERIEDVPMLAEHFLAVLRSHADRRLDGFSDAALSQLRSHDWPGNVRELKNVIERAIVLGQGHLIEADDLSISSLGKPLTPHIDDDSAGERPFRFITLDELEREHIQATLRALDGNKSRASAVLGVERSTLDRKLKRYESDGKS
ncbi:MAG: sigma 54-interacting transcriptional regulator [Pirellulales bacterium]